jgi:hypothetical protein
MFSLASQPAFTSYEPIQFPEHCQDLLIHSPKQVHQNVNFASSSASLLPTLIFAIPKS